MPEGLELELVTVRDWLRYAVSRFGAAGLVYGHGTSNALDEAAYLILHTLHLPIDQLEPWLDARLLPEERRPCQTSSKRASPRASPPPISRRRPGSRGHSFYVDERAIVPRSYIGELLCKQMAGPPAKGRSGLDPLTVGSSAGSLHRFGLPCHSGGAGISRCDDRCQRHLRGRACRRRAQCAATTAWRSASGCSAPICSPPMPASATISSLPIRPMSAREAMAAFPPEYAAEPQDRPCRRRGRTRPGPPHPGRGGAYLTPSRVAASGSGHRPRPAGAGVPAPAFPLARHRGERGRGIRAPRVSLARKSRRLPKRFC